MTEDQWSMCYANNEIILMRSQICSFYVQKQDQMWHVITVKKEITMQMIVSN